jgi:hypothetical protein
MDRDRAEIEQLLIHSGIFCVEDRKPVGVLSLNPGKNYQPFATKSKLQPAIGDLAARVMVRKIRDVIYQYEHDKLDYFALHRELTDEIEQSLLKFIENHNLQKESLEPQYSEFKKKLIRLYKKQIKKDWGPRIPRKSQEKFYRLISPIIRIYRKYLKNPADDLLFHYTAQVLVTCGIEKSHKTRGHLPVYDKIKRFHFRHRPEIKSTDHWHSQYSI